MGNKSQPDSGDRLIGILVGMGLVMLILALDRRSTVAACVGLLAYHHFLLFRRVVILEGRLRDWEEQASAGPASAD